MLVTSKKGCLGVLRLLFVLARKYEVRRNSPMVLGFPGLYRPVGVHLAPSGLELVLFLPQANGRGL